MSIVSDFKSIRRKLERQEQKVEFEAKNPKVEPAMYGWPYGAVMPLAETKLDLNRLMEHGQTKGIA